MPSKNIKKKPDINTELKIKSAARVVFQKKGYAATRTRDIAEEAQVNLALITYYFRSKEKLFQLIMVETLANFFQKLGLLFNDEASTLEEKVQLIAEKYTDLLLEDPEIPLFIMSEIRSHGAAVLKNIPVAGNIMQSVFMKQYKEAVQKGKIIQMEPIHFLINLLGLVVFPFVNSPTIKKVGDLTNRQFEQLMKERKKLIPVWINAMCHAR